MERLHGPINSCYFEEHPNATCVEPEFFTTESLKFDEFEEQQYFSIPMLEDNMPFLQMLQSVGPPRFLPIKEPSFQTLLRLQHLKKPWDGYSYIPEMETQIQSLEFESCITNDIVELHSPVKSETMDLQHSRLEGGSSDCNQDQPSSTENHCIEVTRERRKRKRIRPTKNKEDVESQRMTHIAVERNRRRQMNDHLNVLRSLMPTSYIQRGDQASIIGGAIDFVKELEQLFHSLEAKKRMRKTQQGAEAFPPSGLLTSPQSVIGSEEGHCGEGVKAENKSDVAEIKVTVIQTHVNLKIQGQRRPGQLLKTIVALEELRLTVLHLNITSSEDSVFYSLNLKIEEECKLGSANEIASAVHRILSFIDGS
ncbi:hypothetical protein F2P56_014633 [Juglans regia]|uniref:Transcription factor bHLH67-like isoform X2 n=2 Tax=Juglans regia TaxID=51240 RepID=A0A2I4ETP1_JUGRE|nr:transcription factor bHLH67-like isoform X2 [Juglans regia]KAF5464562.1 hypothetical protein F2P56_014633 [Juglans regia]